MAKKKKKINFKKAIDTAYMALDVHEIKEFPIDMFEIFSDYDNLHVYSYAQIMEMSGKTREKVITDNCSSEGSIAYNADIDQYIITYNEQVIPVTRPKEKIYWTLAHEFGHYLMQHNKEKKASRLSMLSLTENDYDKYEAEADFFARYFLNPPTLVSKANLMNNQKLRSFFGVTYTVAKKTIKFIENQMNLGHRLTPPRKLVKQFSSFLNKVKHGRTCTVCNSFFYNNNPLFCPMCGNSKTHIFYKGDDLNMKYPGVELNDNHRAIECPKCKNEEILGDYCQICGTYLINKCTGFDAGDYDRHIHEISWHEHLPSSCGNLLNSNARYCSKCGRTSTFYEIGLLESWETLDKELEEPKKERQLKVVNGHDPFADESPIDIDDEDLPF